MLDELESQLSAASASFDAAVILSDETDRLRAGVRVYKALCETRDYRLEHLEDFPQGDRLDQLTETLLGLTVRTMVELFGSEPDLELDFDTWLNERYTGGG